MLFRETIGLSVIVIVVRYLIELLSIQYIKRI